MIIHENDCCSICGKHRSDTATGRLVRDHNHQTDEIRGLLCDLCNSYVGIYEWKRPRNAKFEKWFKKYEESVLLHLSKRTGLSYSEYRKNRSAAVHVAQVVLVKHKKHKKHIHLVKVNCTNAKVLCKVCGKVEAIKNHDNKKAQYSLACGHVRGF